MRNGVAGGRKDARDVILFTVLVLVAIVVLFFVIGYVIGSAIV
ncbi:MAG: hypothetical protein Kow00122_01710 [Thermoleophilia bacterium]